MVRLVSGADAWQVRHYTAEDLTWPDRGNPSYRVGRGSYGGRSVVVHPRPMYPHDAALVERTLRAIEAVHPLAGARCELAILDREFESGFNGYAMPDAIYKRDDGSAWEVRIPDAEHPSKDLHLNGQALMIVLSAKVVPLLPAWTRYLVAHEYGHCAWYHATRLMGWTTGGNRIAERTYMQVTRGLVDWEDGKRWHQLAAEVIANDFRIAVAGVESEFWQHDVEPPGDRVRLWWAHAALVSEAGHPDDR